MTVKESKALEAARRFQRHREAVAQSLDEAAAAFAAAFASHVRIARAQQTQLTEAGHDDLAVNLGPKPAHVEAALAHALDEIERQQPDVRIPCMFDWRNHITAGYRAPLAESDPRPVLLSEGS